MKLLILTTDPTLLKWKTLDRKLAAIKAALDSGKNANWDEIEVKYVSTVPSVTDNQRISPVWLKNFKAPYFKQGYDIIGLHMSQAQWKEWGIQGTLAGFNLNRKNEELEDFYFLADERSTHYGLDRFVQLVIHELSHGYYDHSGETDITHAWRDTKTDMTGLPASFDWAKYQPERMALKKELRQTQFNFLGFVGQLLTNMSRRLVAKPTLFAAAREYLGRDASPKDLAPDLLGCSESVTNIIQDVLPDFPIITGTWTLWDMLENDARFRRVTVPMPGTLIISPTGTSKSKRVKNGHVGIFARDLNIMSSNSSNGLWEENYTLDSWNARYKAAGYQTYMYQLIN